LDGQDTRDLFISAVTLGELFKGASHHPDENRRRKLTAWLEEELQVAFHGRILALDSLAARTWGRIQGEALRQGTPLSILDSMIAAIAQAHGLVVVTRNTRDFSRTGAQIFNPWDEGGLPR
jgi:hypothetical protein